MSAAQGDNRQTVRISCGGCITYPLLTIGILWLLGYLA